MAVVEAHAQAQAAHVVRLAIADGSVVDGQSRRRGGGDCHRQRGKRKKLGDSREQHRDDLSLLWCCNCCRGSVFVWCVELEGGRMGEEKSLWRRKAQDSFWLPKSDMCDEGADLPIVLVVMGMDSHPSLGLPCPHVLSCCKLIYVQFPDLHYRFRFFTARSVYRVTTSRQSSARSAGRQLKVGGSTFAVLNTS